MKPLPRPTTLGIVGAGRVGRAVTAAVVTAGVASTVLVNSRRPVESTALAIDAADLAATQHIPIRIEAVEHPRELLDAALLIVCVRARFTTPLRTGGVGCYPTLHWSPTSPTSSNVSLGGGTVTNPVDVTSRIFAKHSNAAVLGVGSNLDSACYRTLTAEHLAVPITAVAGSVLGEHGETAVICAHATRVYHQPVQLPLDHIWAQLHQRFPRITAGMDRTQHGPAGAVLSTVVKLLGLADGHEELSVATGGSVRRPAAAVRRWPVLERPARILPGRTGRPHHQRTPAWRPLRPRPSPALGPQEGASRCPPQPRCI